MLIFYESRSQKRPRTDDGEGVDPYGVISIRALPDQILVLVAPVTEDDTILTEQGWGFTLWSDHASESRALPDIETALLHRMRNIQPADTELIPVIDAWNGKQTGVAVRDHRGGYDIRDFEGRLSTAVREVVIDTLTGTLLGTILPGPGPTSLDTIISALEKLLEPHEILLAFVNAAARALAFHAGLGIIAPLIGKFAENTVRSLLDQDAEDHQAATRLVKALKIAAYAEADTLAEGLTSLFLAPAVESELMEATDPVDWVQAGYDRRRAVQLGLYDDDGTAAGSPRESLAAALDRARRISQVTKEATSATDTLSAI
jgi:hypothetical protein